MKKILVGEDDQSILEVIKIILEGEGFEIFAASDQENLHKLVNNHIPDLILLDIWLSGQDGGQIAKKLKSTNHTKHIPIILISANNETPKIAEEAGVEDFILKPFDIDDLLNLVKKYL